jgi:hypothetical protein
MTRTSQLLGSILQGHRTYIAQPSRNIRRTDWILQPTKKHKCLVSVFKAWKDSKSCVLPSCKVRTQGGDVNTIESIEPNYHRGRIYIQRELVMRLCQAYHVTLVTMCTWFRARPTSLSRCFGDSGSRFWRTFSFLLSSCRLCRGEKRLHYPAINVGPSISDLVACTFTRGLAPRI